MIATISFIFMIFAIGYLTGYKTGPWLLNRDKE